MQSTALPHLVDDLSDAERTALLDNQNLRSLADVCATIPDPRKRRGQRYDLPFLLTCLMAALL